MEESSELQTAVLEAFYARVMHRVCSAYRDESELPADAAVTRLQQKWKEKLALYTGKREQQAATAEEVEPPAAEVVQSPDENEASDDEDDVSSVSSSSSSSSSASSSVASAFASEAAPQMPIGRPSAELPSAATSATSSIFSRMLGGKRKLHQLDGTVSDDEDAAERQDASESKEQKDTQDEDSANSEVLPSVVHVNGDDEDANEVGDGIHQDTRGEEEEKEDDVLQNDEELPSSPARSTTSASLLVFEEDIAPVSGLSGVDLPLQLAAECTTFGHRGVCRGYAGNLRAIVLTWPSRLSASESILPGDLVWCYGEHGVDGHLGLVKVVSLGDTLDELKVEDAKGAAITVPMHRVRRLKEYLIRKGTVQLRGNR